MSGELMPWHLNWLVKPEYNRVDLVKEGANTGARIKLIKSKGGNTVKTLEEILKAMTAETAAVVTEAIEKAKQEAADAKAEVEKTKTEMTAAVEKARKEAAGTPESSDPEEILKSIQDPAVKALLQTQIAKTAAAETEIKKAREAALEAEAVAKAADVMGIPAKTEDLVTLYKGLQNVNPDLCGQVFSIFKATSTALKDGSLFTEMGNSGASSAAEGGQADTIWNQIEKSAESIRKEKPEMNYRDSITKAIEGNKDLYNQYLQATRS